MEPYALGTMIRKKDFGEMFEIVDANENPDSRHPALGPYNYMVDPPVPNGVYHGQIGPGLDQPFEIVEEEEIPTAGGPLVAEF